MYDYHVHSNYSDGDFLVVMLRAAESAGLDGVGFADHCDTSDREFLRDVRAEFGFNLDLTYPRRRRGIDSLRDRFDLAVYDAVEMNYYPWAESRIRTFLETAEFEYAIGSVHTVAEHNVQDTAPFEGLSESELDAVVDQYFERLVALAESELFDVAAHPDLIERTPPLRGRATDSHYRRAASAFADSRTVPEINAGRALTDAGVVHPSDGFLSVLCDHEVPVTVGTDSHHPGEIDERAAFLEDFLADRGLTPVEPPSLR